MKSISAHTYLKQTKCICVHRMRFTFTTVRTLQNCYNKAYTFAAKQRLFHSNTNAFSGHQLYALISNEINQNKPMPSDFAINKWQNTVSPNTNLSCLANNQPHHCSIKLHGFVTPNVSTCGQLPLWANDEQAGWARLNNQAPDCSKLPA